MNVLSNPSNFCCRHLAALAMLIVACNCMADPPLLSTAAETKQSTKASVVIGESLKSKKPLAPEKLSSPFGVAFDSNNNMYIVELSGGRIHRRDSTGTLSIIAGDGSKGYSGDTGPATEATFNGMHNIAATAEGDLYIADSWNHCVRKIDTKTGVISTFAGTGEAGFSGDGGPANAAKFNFLMCVSLNPTQDKLYVADLKNRRVRMIDLKSNIVTTVAGNGKKGVPKNGSDATTSPLIDPRAVAVDSHNNLYVLERSGHALRKVNAAGKIETVAGTGKPGNALGKALESQFNSPKHLAITQGDHVIIADDQNARVVRYDPRQQTVNSILGKGVEQPKRGLLRPHGICIHEDGSIYIVDTGHHRILRLTTN